MKYLRQWLCLSLAVTALASCPRRPYSTWMADSIISRGQGIASSDADISMYLQIGYFQTALLRLLESPLAAHCAEQDYRSHIQKGSGSVMKTLLNVSEDILLPLDRLSLGRGLLAQYIENQDTQAVKSALDTLRESIDLQPKNQYGGLWYYAYPNVSYLDGMYSYVPFYSLYTTAFDVLATTNTTDAIIFQLDLLWTHCYDNSTGLLFHGYDATKTAVWANPHTGSSSIVWGRSVGWFLMALVDWLDMNSFQAYYSSHQWNHIHSRFVALADAVVKAVDPVTGAWWQVMNYPGREGNYIESSASSMFVYALYKGARLGYFHSSGHETEEKYMETAERAFGYLADTFVVKNQNGTLSWNGTVSVCSLNSTATYEYYVNQPLLFNSVLGSVSFVLASLENEIHSYK